jgi:hypothetical protein
MDYEKMNKVANRFCKLADLTESMIEAEPITQRSPTSDPPPPESVDVTSVQPKLVVPFDKRVNVRIGGDLRTVNIELDLVPDKILITDYHTGEDITDQVPVYDLIRFISERIV